MNIFNKIKNRINENLTTENSEDGFSMIEGVMGIAIMTTLTAVGVGTVNENGFMGILDNAKQAQSASLLQDTMTNIIFYDIDGDPETDTQYAIDEFNKVNTEKGFTADYRQNDDCLAVQVMADNGLNSIQTDGKNCERLVEELNKKADEIKNTETESEDNPVLAYIKDYTNGNTDGDTEVEIVYNLMPREVLEEVAADDN